MSTKVWLFRDLQVVYIFISPPIAVRMSSPKEPETSRASDSKWSTLRKKWL